MPISSDSERSSLRPSFATSPPSPCPRADSVRPPKAYLSPDSSPPVRKTEFAKIYDLLLRLSEGESVEEDIQNKFTVSSSDWLELKDEIFVKGDRVSSETRAWANIKLRYNYDAEAGTFEVKMADAIHESCKTALVKLLEARMAPYTTGIIRQGLPPNLSLETLKDWAHTMTPLASGSFRAPDIAFSLGQWPPIFIAEIANGEHGKRNFKGKAKDYMSGTRGVTKTLLGIDFEYPVRRNGVNELPRWATYQFFRCKIMGDDFKIISTGKKPVRFKNANGVINSHFKVRLTLADFVTSDDPVLLNFPVHITHQDLYNVVASAERAQQTKNVYILPVPLKYVGSESPSPEPEEPSSSPEQDTDDTGTFSGRKSRVSSNDATSVGSRVTRGSDKRGGSSAGGETSEETSEEDENEEDDAEDEEDSVEVQEDDVEDEEDDVEDEEDDEEEARPHKRRR